MTKKNLMLITLVAILVFAQATVAFADPSGPESPDFTPGGTTILRPEPVGGHTEPVKPLALLWPWLALAAAAATSTIAVVMLKWRTV